MRRRYDEAVDLGVPDDAAELRRRRPSAPGRSRRLRAPSARAGTPRAPLRCTPIRRSPHGRSR
jgi:hypothetical protein